MNKVDIYIGDYRLDLFQDEEIKITLSVQNLQDISKVFTDFTQSFTIPASGINNEVLKQYYRTDVDSSLITTYATTNYTDWADVPGAWNELTQAINGGLQATSVPNNYDFRFRVPARIELNSLPFRTGVIEMENVLLKGTEPYSYSLSFYGDLVSLSDLLGEDYLYDLDFSSYDYTYNGATINQLMCDDNLFNGDLFCPLMSPIRDWRWDAHAGVDDDLDIKYTQALGHQHGVSYYELKPALKVARILDAIEAKYGISFTGTFLSDAQFNKLFLWLHRFEGYLYTNASVIDWQIVDFNNKTTGVSFDLATDIWTVPQTDEFNIRVDVSAASAKYELGLFRNGVEVGIAREDAGTNASFFDGFIFAKGDEIQLKIRPQIPADMTYRVIAYAALTEDIIPTTIFDVNQTAQVPYPFQVAVSPLMPEIKIKDFLGGIIKMHNLVITPVNSTTFNLQTLNAWYAAGVNQDITQYVDISEVSVERPELYREIEFKYQDTEQILGYEYQRQNAVGFGNLNADFEFDGGEFNVELPFECPLFERLSNEDTGLLTDVLIYKSVTRDTSTVLPQVYEPYVGSPILFYGEFPYNVEEPIGFVDEAEDDFPCSQVWYANTSSTSLGAGLAYTITWGSDIDPYYLTSLGKSLYQTYWEDYISDLYDSKRRVFNVNAILPLGKILTLQLNNKLIWNNQRWIVNSANINMSTGKASFQLLNDV